MGQQLAATQPAVTESTFDQTRKVEQLFFQKFSEKYQLNTRGAALRLSGRCMDGVRGGGVD